MRISDWSSDVCSSDLRMAKSESEKPGFFANNALRVAAPENKVGISGCDHVGLPARDPEAAGRFIEQILGGVEFVKAGYSVRDIELGRPKHIFYHVGNLVVEVAAQKQPETGPHVAPTTHYQPTFPPGT